MAQRQAPGVVEEVDPNVDQTTPRAEGEITTLEGEKGLFAGDAVVVDEVVEQPMATGDPEGGWWIIRPNVDVEHMSVGTVDNSYAFKTGVRYKVPADVMTILLERDHLLERPYPA